MFSVLAYMKGLVLTNHWRTIDLVKDITIPILYITGANDEIVPTEMTVALHEASNNARENRIWVNPDGTHNDSWYVNKAGYLYTLGNFFNGMHHDGKLLRDQSASAGTAAINDSESVKNVNQRNGADILSQKADRIK